MQKKTLSKLALRCMAVLAILGALVLLGCPDDNDDAETRPVNNVVVPIDEGTVAALNGETFAFAGGVTDFGTTAATNTVFTTTAGATTAAITAGGDTADTTVTFGSCIFTVGANGLPPVLEPGAVITVNPCSIEIDAGNVPVGGSVTGSATLRLGNSISAAVAIEVELGPNGELIINGVDTGLVVSPTGTTGTGTGGS